MYLSRLVLNPRSQWVQQDCANRYEIHKTIYSGFPETLPESERILFRLESGRNGVITVLVQSQDAPQWSTSEQINRPDYLLCAIDEKIFEPHFYSEQVLRFRLTANPTVKREGKRLALRKEADQLAWLQRKAEGNGFQLEQLHVTKEGDVIGWRTGQRLTWHSTRFDGVLRVKDAALFSMAVRQGIGAAKSFGFGLLSVIPYASM